MKKLPEHLKKLKQTDIFNNQTAPPNIQKEHMTASGVWGLLTIVSGTLEYVIGENVSYMLTADFPGVIEPEVSHYVKLDSDVEFYITFYQEVT